MSVEWQTILRGLNRVRIYAQAQDAQRVALRDIDRAYEAAGDLSLFGTGGYTTTSARGRLSAFRARVEMHLPASDSAEAPVGPWWELLKGAIVETYHEIEGLSGALAKLATVSFGDEFGNVAAGYLEQAANAGERVVNGVTGILSGTLDAILRTFGATKDTLDGAARSVSMVGTLIKWVLPVALLAIGYLYLARWLKLPLPAFARAT